MKFVERWHSDAFESREIAYQIYEDVKKKLKIIPHPYTGWRSFPNQRLKTININENGLRSKSLNKLKFDNNHWPYKIDSINNSEVINWLQNHIYLKQIIY